MGVENLFGPQFLAINRAQANTCRVQDELALKQWLRSNGKHQVNRLSRTARIRPAW